VTILMRLMQHGPHIYKHNKDQLLSVLFACNRTDHDDGDYDHRHSLSTSIDGY
jgi:hypothetical protein